MQIPEYDPSDETTLKVLTEGDVISATEAECFREELVRIAGKTFDGQPRLRLVWGPTHIDPMSQDQTQIKYLDFTHKGTQLGERRWFIEIYRSPDFLVKSGRYQTVNAPDSVLEFYFCKACGMEVGRAEPEVCECGSKRFSLKQSRTMGEQQLLKEFPRQGCYDYWFRLERRNLTYHAPDAEALEFIKALWDWESKPENQRNALAQADSELKRRKAIEYQRQQTQTRVHFSSSPLIIPA